jgi:oxygen-independent coproporphyrinogen-3 oxidase
MIQSSTGQSIRLAPFDIPVALYIHFPWCVKKCPYCDFNSHEAGSETDEDAYIDRLLQDLDTDAPMLAGRQVCSIFMGGGTPSLFSDHSLASLMSGIRQRVELTPDIEITLECNPATGRSGRQFSGYLSAGINRLSLGAQSFCDDSLVRLGRIHASQDILSTYQFARQAGFDNINLDLMHGLPGQSVAMALADLQHAVDLAPEHLSWYQLTIEPNTVFYNRPPELPNEDLLWEIDRQGRLLLDAAGYRRYEISAFSTPGFDCRHNQNYWQFGDYLGIGAGAHGKISTADAIVRTAKTRLPKDYLAHPTSRSLRVEPDAVMLEFLMNALRLTTGFQFAGFEQRTGLSRTELTDFITRAYAAQLVEIDDAWLRPTSHGLQFLDEMLMLVD